MDDNKNKYAQRSLDAHKLAHGKIEIHSRMPLATKDDLSIAYTPGVAAPSMAIYEHPETVYDYTSKGHLIAVISDGSAVLGLGNIGARASLPVMEGKCVLFKAFANVDAVPIVIDSQNPEVIVQTVRNIAGTFGGINLEDISAPRCFEVERRLKEECDIPVLHDDQHGTAIVTLAAMINSMRVTGRKLEEVKVVMSGAGAAGVAIAKLLRHVGVQEILMCDRTGILYEGREGMNAVKQEMAELTNRAGRTGSLNDALKDADVFIGVSSPDLLDENMIRSMAAEPIIFAMANPIPEIMPEHAHAAGARIVATGRSDYPNQINNVLAFPGLFRGILDARGSRFTIEMFVAAAQAIADSVDKPSEEEIIPSPFNRDVPDRVAEAVRTVCREAGCSALYT